MRRDFSERSQAMIVRITTAGPFDGRCPCCSREHVLSEGRRPAPGAEFDHFFHHSLNRSEHGCLICAACHAELTRGGYSSASCVPEFRAFPAAAFGHRRRERAAPDEQAE